jgi:hypothetical protein
VHNKTRRFKENGLYLWDPSSGQCLLPPAPAAVQAATRSTWRLKIRVLTSTRPASLQRLLTSLETAQYRGINVSLEMVVDPPAEDDAVSAATFAETLRVVRGFQFSKGASSVHLFEQHAGIVRMWVEGAVADDELLLVLEDDIEVSPFFAVFLGNAINQYYVNSSQYDPQMFGIMLQRQHTILGETPTAKYGKHKPDQLLEDGAIFYRYQLMSTWAPLYFPQPWRDFQQWLVPLAQNKTYVPCVPALMSNNWAKQVGRVWSPYFVRFAYERGLYGLYMSHPQGLALATNHKEPGLHFNGTAKLQDVTPLVSTEDELRALLDFPNLRSIPLYDYHMREVSNASVLLLRPRFVGVGVDDCHTITKPKQG